MEFNLFKIDIKDSFNKKDTSTNVRDNISGDSLNPILNKNNNLIQTSSSINTNSVNTSSVTNGQLDNALFYKTEKEREKTISREIIVGIVSSAIGSIVGVIISYLIFGIK